MTSKDKAPALTNTSSLEYTDFMGARKMSLWLVASISADSYQQLCAVVNRREVWPPMRALMFGAETGANCRVQKPGGDSSFVPQPP